MNNEEKYLELYTAAFAPLGSDTILGDIEELSLADFTPDAVLDELHYVRELQNIGLQKFESYLEEFRDTEPAATPQEVGAGMVCLSAFLKRLHTLNSALMEMVDQLATQYSDPTPTLKAFEADVKANRRPKDPRAFNNLLDMTPNRKWEMVEDALKESSTNKEQRVLFKETATVYMAGGGEEEEEALKVSEIKRKKQRNPTGYQKFTFRDLNLGTADGSFSTEDIHSTSTTRAASLSAPESHRDSRASSDFEQGFGWSSARGSSTAASRPSFSEEEPIGMDESDLNQIRVQEEVRKQEELNPFKRGSRSGSSVIFSFDKERDEIADPLADPEWNKEDRHERRFTRIRNRVPTGHPAVMKTASDELQHLLEDLSVTGEEGQERHWMEETIANTDKNRRTSTALN